MIDLRRRLDGNVLVPSRDPDQVGAKDHVWWLDPGPYAVVPLLAQRVIKVEDFYCIIQVEEDHFLEPAQPYLDSMKLEVRFSNTNPLGQ